MKFAVFAAPNGQQPAILRALANLGALRVNQAAALKQLRIRRRVEAAAKDFDELRTALVRQHGTPGEGESVTVGKEALPAFIADFNELCAQDVPTEMLAETISIEELWARGPNGEREPLELAVNDMDALGELLALEAPAEKPAANGNGRVAKSARKVTAAR